MVDRMGTVQIDEQALALAPRRQPLQSPPHGSVPPRGRLPVTAARLPSPPGAPIPTLCQNCSSRGERDDDTLHRTTHDLELNGEDTSSVCGLCGCAPTGGHALPRSTGIVEPGSVVEFVNIHDASGKPDGKTVNQVRGYIMRRIHQARRESQGRPMKTSQNNKRPCDPREVVLALIKGYGRTVGSADLVFELSLDRGDLIPFSACPCRTCQNAITSL
jgi:hypothetical protein